MLSNREFSEEEVRKFGVFGRIHDKSDIEYGQRSGVILVHGRAGNETLMWVFSKIIQDMDPVVVAPRALEQDPIGGYSWWLTEHRKASTIESPAPVKTSLDELEPALITISQIANVLCEDYGVSPSRIYAFGFSQGAALVGSLSLMEPELFSRVGMLAGFLPRSVMNFFSEQKFSRLPEFFLSHGTKDQIIPFKRALETKDYLLNKDARVAFHSDEVGHKISSSGMRECKKWFNEQLV